MLYPRECAILQAYFWNTRFQDVHAAEAAPLSHVSEVQAILCVWPMSSKVYQFGLVYASKL